MKCDGNSCTLIHVLVHIIQVRRKLMLKLLVLKTLSRVSNQVLKSLLKMTSICVRQIHNFLMISDFPQFFPGWPRGLDGGTRREVGERGAAGAVFRGDNVLRCRVVRAQSLCQAQYRFFQHCPGISGYIPKR